MNEYKANRHAKIKHGQFKLTLLLHKHFLEEWYMTLGRFLEDNKLPVPKVNFATAAQKQSRIIDDLIDKAISKDYLMKSHDGLDQILTIDWRGRQFLNPIHIS